MKLSFFTNVKVEKEIEVELPLYFRIDVTSKLFPQIPKTYIKIEDGHIRKISRMPFHGKIKSIFDFYEMDNDILDYIFGDVELEENEELVKIEAEEFDAVDKLTIGYHGQEGLEFPPYQF